MSYIEREAALKAILEHPSNIAPFTRKAIDAIENLPTADVVEVRHGHWSKYEVSAKGYGKIYYQHKECDVDQCQLFRSPHSFCPCCGAKMDGRREENEGIYS